MSITLQRLSYKRIGEITNQFLTSYHPHLSLPIPHVLVPTQLLLNELRKRLGRIPSQEAPEILATVTEDLLDVFQVSGDVLARRLVKEGIVKFNS